MIKYIFSINTGRSGSNYLYRLFASQQGFKAFHEPNPIMNGKPMRDYLKGDEKSIRALAKKKVNRIQQAIENSGLVYVETNNAFIKGFGWILMEMLPHDQVGVIILKRNKKEIVDSLIRINCTPLSELGADWLITPSIKKPINSVQHICKLIYFILSALIRKTNKKNNWIKAYEKKWLSWYVDETYAQAERFRHLFPMTKVFSTDIVFLNELSEVERMFKFFDYEISDNRRLKLVLGKKTNIIPAGNKSILRTKSCSK